MHEKQRTHTLIWAEPIVVEGYAATLRFAAKGGIYELPVQPRALRFRPAHRGDPELTASDAGASTTSERRDALKSIKFHSSFEFRMTKMRNVAEVVYTDGTG